MRARRRRHTGITAHTRDTLEPLFMLTVGLNRVGPWNDPEDAALEASITARVSAIVRAVITSDATGGPPPPRVPPAAARHLAAWVRRVPFRYFLVPGKAPRMQTGRHNPYGTPLTMVMAYLQHPARDRLHKCPVCGTWFVDYSRNKSKLRCSRACTVRWTTEQERRRTHAEA